MTLRRWSSAVVLGLLAGCASRRSEPTEPTSAPARSVEANPGRSNASNAGANRATRMETPTASKPLSVDAASPSESARVASSAARPNGPAQFPPADFPPPSTKSAAPGDGRWTPFVANADPASPLVARTVVHPHPDSKWGHGDRRRGRS